MSSYPVGSKPWSSSESMDLTPTPQTHNLRQRTYCSMVCRSCRSKAWIIQVMKKHVPFTSSTEKIRTSLCTMEHMWPTLPTSLRMFTDCSQDILRVSQKLHCGFFSLPLNICSPKQPSSGLSFCLLASPLHAWHLLRSFSHSSDC